MNKITLLICIWGGVVLTPHLSIAQNTFPSSGNVGIGTNSPNKLLDVNGKSIFRDKAVFDGVLKYDFYKRH